MTKKMQFMPSFCWVLMLLLVNITNNIQIKVMTVGMSYNDLHKQIEETKRKTKAKCGLDFASYGTIFLGYEGDWEKPDGQYKLWDIKDSGGKDEKGRV